VGQPPDVRAAVDDDEIDVMPYVVGLWQRRWAIVLVTLVCGLVAVFASWRAPRMYEAHAAVTIVAVPKSGSQTPAITAAAFRTVLSSADVGGQVVRGLGLDQPPYRLTAGTFLGSCTKIDVVGDANLVAITVTLPDPDMAAKAANHAIAAATGVAQKGLQDEASAVRDALKRQVARARERLGEVQARLAALNKKDGQPIQRSLRIGDRQTTPLGDLAGRDQDRARLQSDYDVLESVYYALATRYEIADLQADSPAVQFQAQNASAPAAPVSARPSRVAFMAMLAGFVLSAAAIVCAQWIAMVRRAWITRPGTQRKSDRV
jgi:uncharacterized protein involved in exopolysaccharide biosynthesis